MTKQQLHQQREIAEYLYKYEKWDYRCALIEAEKRVKRGFK